MILNHHDLKIELPDAWWDEAGMADFVSYERAFRADLGAANGEVVFEARIDEVGPVRRNPGVCIFNDNEEATARDRVIRILKGFREGVEIPPIILVTNNPNCIFRYKLSHGCHRFYCSLAAGFSHIPAIEGSDLWFF